MTTISQDAWTELAYVAITAKSTLTSDLGSDVQFQSITETIDIDTGEKDFTSIATISGARLVKFTPETDTTITLEAYPLYSGSTATIAKESSTATGRGFFDLLHQTVSTEPLVVPSSLIRNKYRIAILWCDDSTTTNAATTVTSGAKALRFVGADGYFTAVKPSFTDGLLKFTVTFKVPPFDSSGNSNIKMESVSGGAEIAQLASYGASTKW